MKKNSFTRQGWKALGDLLKASREEKGWSLRALSQKLGGTPGASVGAVSAVERGNVEPKLSTLESLLSLDYVKDPKTGKPMTINELCEFVRINGGDASVGVSRRKVGGKSAGKKTRPESSREGV
jgi:transcriptional regulator with XRE-family HTH domain